MFLLLIYLYVVYSLMYFNVRLTHYGLNSLKRLSKFLKAAFGKLIQVILLFSFTFCFDKESHVAQAVPLCPHLPSAETIGICCHSWLCSTGDLT